MHSFLAYKERVLLFGYKNSTSSALWSFKIQLGTTLLFLHLLAIRRETDLGWWHSYVFI